MQEQMLFRLGSALILMAVIILVVFALTLSVDQGDVRVLIAGAGLALLGLLIHRSARRDRLASGRFRTLRRILGDTSREDGSSE
jgi:hypothetical protein